MFVSAGDEGEEEGGGFWVEGDVPDFVDDEEWDPSETFQLVGESAGSFGFSSRIAHAVAVANATR